MPARHAYASGESADICFVAPEAGMGAESCGNQANRPTILPLPLRLC